jgi:hypothetical protein
MPTSNTEYELMWPELDAGPCPTGYYCHEGSDAPEACPAVRVTIYYYRFTKHNNAQLHMT